MKMHVLPPAIFLLPNSSFLDGSGHGGAVFPDPLIQANISDHRHVAHDPDSGRAHGSLMLSTSAAQLKVKTMKVQTFDELPLGFRLKGGQSRIAEFLVNGPISVGNRIQQTLIESQEFVIQGIGHWHQTSLAVSPIESPKLHQSFACGFAPAACFDSRYLYPANSRSRLRFIAAALRQQDTNSLEPFKRMNNSNPSPRSSLDNNETRT
jgi:hypothetical protein